LFVDVLFFIFTTMPIQFSGVGIPANLKRSTPESFDTTTSKKAKYEDGQTASESKDMEAKPVSKGDGEKVKTDESKDSAMHGGDVKQKESGKPIESQHDGDETKPTGDSQVNESKDAMTENQVKPKSPPTGYLMNVNNAVDVAYHGTALRQIIDLPVTALQGIGEQRAEVLNKFKVKTVRDLANWKFYQIAKSIKALAEVEEEDGRVETSMQNINDALDKDFEKSSLSTIMQQKVEVLQGVGEYRQGQLSKVLGITYMEDLANYKLAKYAAALVTLADYETTGFESKTTTNDSTPLSTFRPVAA